MLQNRAAAGTPLRVGVIGPGTFGALYIAPVPRTPGVHRTGIADLSPPQAPTHLGRTGGEEFLVILPGTGLADAEAMAERLREAVQAIDLSAVQPGLQAHASVGGAQWRRGDTGREALIQR